MSELQSIADFQAKMLRSLPNKVRADAKQIFEAWNNLSPDEQRAEMALKREQYQRDLSKGLDFRRRENCGLTLKQWANTFATYRPDSHEQRVAKTAAIEFATSFPAVERGLMFYGKPGRGKDHLLHAIVIALLDREGVRADIRYWYTLDIERLMIAEWESSSRSEETRVEEQMRSCDLLLIGDLHKIKLIKSDQCRHAFVRVINQAETTGKPIICASSNRPLSYFDSLDEDGALGSRCSAIFDRIHVDSPVDARRMRGTS